MKLKRNGYAVTTFTLVVANTSKKSNVARKVENSFLAKDVKAYF